MPYDFQDLRLGDKSRKVYKFQQRKSLPQGNTGECLGVALAWVKEKITQPRFGFRNTQFTGQEGRVEATHNAEILAVIIKYGPPGEKDQLVFLEEKIKLKRRECIHSFGGSVHGEDVYPIIPNIQRVARDLHHGEAAVMRFHLWREVGGQSKRGGHAIALYRSRGDTLYFFDPNCGVYEVYDGKFGAFAASWVAACQARGWSDLTPYNYGKEDPDGWCTIYRR